MITATQFASIGRCPRCHASISDAIGCPQCGLQYSLGATRFIEDAGSDAGFDERWNQHRKPQATTEPQFWAKTLWKPEELKGKLVLDGGCGIGRFSAIASRCGADVLALDVSPSGIAATADNAPEAFRICSSILNIPLQDATVDYAFSIGVLHHTGSTKKGFDEMARVVKPGGKLAVWVYSNPGGTKQTDAAITFLHDVTRAIPPEVLHRICMKHAGPLYDAFYPSWSELAQVIRPSFSPDAAERQSDFFDWHAPTYRDHYSIEELSSWFKAVGFKDLKKTELPTGISATKNL